MDETEVQVEIACWAQDHPEAERINWQGGNEPWVSFPGKLCTLHIGLGGLIWSIGVPIGYQTELSPTDGSRKRCWDAFDFHDTVIVPDKNTPFRVSVLYPRNDINNVLEETRLLVQQPGYDFQNAQENVINLFKHLQISDDNSDTSSDQEQRLLTTSRACFQAMIKAETLSEILDAIHALTTYGRWSNAASLSTGAKLDELHTADSMDCDSNTSKGESSEDDLFAPELAYKWSWIKTQVEYAADACRTARNRVEIDVTDPHSSNGPLVLGIVEARDGQEIAENATGTFRSRMRLDINTESTHTTDDFAHVRGTSSTLSRKNIDIVNSMSPSSSDSELSVDTDEEDSWEYLEDTTEEVSTDFLSDSEGTGMQGQSPSRNNRNLLQVFTPAQGAGAGAARIADIPSASTTATSYEKTPEDRFDGQGDVLQHCDIIFNSASLSVECTIQVEKFMHNNTPALTAMGLSLEHPLRVEVVPNKEQVDALAWTGLVEVYVSQQSEWHSHVSEEVCGLLCFIPHIVRHYFGMNVLADPRLRPTRKREGELFTGLLETVVRRLANLSRDLCCICSRPLDELSRTFIMRIMWPCDDNMCQALYASWQAVSSYDAEERTRQERESLEEVEKDLREDFPYSEYILDNLRSALDVYSVDSEGLHYGQMIRALARIELWNRRDLDQIS